MATSVVVLGYGREEFLEECLASVAPQLGPDDEVVLVDNGVHDMAARREELSRYARIVGEPQNRGFAGGCNVGADEASGETLVFLNSDAVLLPGALAELVAPLRDEGLGIASGCLLLADRPDRVNSVGNPISYIGITWAGSLGDPWSDHSRREEISCATGGFFAIRRALWDELGGFDDVYFAYHEDTDLSLRVRLSGRRIEYVPTAQALHHYEFSRNAFKMYLLERNRFLVLLADFPRPVLRRVVPALVVTEPAMLAVAVAQGWAGQKLKSWWWLLTHRDEIRRLRDKAEEQTVISPVEFAGLLVDHIDAPGAPRPPGMGVLNALLRAWWRIAAPRRS